jgi:uncharacterized membrane protein (UPF0136 family)
MAGLFGEFGQLALPVLLLPGGLGSYTASLVELTGLVRGAFIFVCGKLKERPARCGVRLMALHFSRDLGKLPAFVFKAHPKHAP